ncbi:MAG: M56 family metallopeptidase [Flavobacteriaceae bacterium]
MEFCSYLLKSAGVLTLFYGVYQLFLRKETFFVTNRHFLLLGIFASLLLPLWYFTQSVTVQVEVLDALPFSENTTTAIPSELPIPSETDVPAIGFTQLLVGTYLFGILLLLIRLGIQGSSLVRLLKKYPSRRENGLLKVPANEKTAPFSFFQYLVYNPTQHSEAELQMIFKHEQVHIEQRHSIDVIVGNLLVIFQWFNPIAWLYKKVLEENLEFIADNHTAQVVPSRKAYQMALVKAASPWAPALTNPFYQSFIKKRIIMLNKSNSKKHRVFKVLAIMPLLALFLFGFNVKKVTNYVEIPAKKRSLVTEEIPASNAPEKKYKTEGNHEIQNSTPDVEAKETDQNPERSNAVILEFRYEINKNTSEEELKRIKDDLKKNHGIDLSYTTVRNDQGEITSLSINYSGKGVTGKNLNGNYSVSDDDGIEPFFFYQDDDGSSGFWSEGAEERRLERMERRQEDLEKRKEEMEERREKIEVRRMEMEKRREKMEMKRKEDLDKKRVELIKKSGNVAIVGDERAVYEIVDLDDLDADENVNVVSYVVASPSGARSYIIDTDDVMEVDNVKTTEYVVARPDGNVAYVSSTGNAFSINKSTTDAQLKKIQQQMAQKNIEFKYRNVKRNNRGEITGLKFSVDDHHGSKSSTTIKSDGEKPIDPIFINQ